MVIIMSGEHPNASTGPSTSVFVTDGDFGGTAVNSSSKLLPHLYNVPTVAGLASDRTLNR
jgi:hypothetical protein